MNRVMVIDALNMFIRNYIVNPMISTNGNPIGGAVGFNCKKFPEMVCSKEVSFKAWQNWWDGDTKHYMAFRAAPLYKENGNWKKELLYP